jgi:SH3-like domain-containing protein
VHEAGAPRSESRAKRSDAHPHVAGKPHSATVKTHLAIPPKGHAEVATKRPVPAATPKVAEAHPAPPVVDLNKGSVTGLPLPRFASMRADDVNLRAGPGTRYPIEWLYKRRGLPVEIEREFEVWRLVQAPDGAKGWVHEATLMGRRDFLIIGADRPLRNEPQEAAHAIAILKPGVVGHIRSCDAGSDWCRVQVGEYRGWLKRDEFWGTQPGEAVASG